MNTAEEDKALPFTITTHTATCLEQHDTESRKPSIPHSRDHTPAPVAHSKRNLSVFKQAEDGTFKKLFTRRILDRKWMLTSDVLQHVKSLADEMEKEGHIWCKVGLVRNDAVFHHHKFNAQPLYPVVSIPRGFGAKGRIRGSWTFTCTLGGRCLHSPCHSDIPSVEDAPQGPDPNPDPSQAQPSPANPDLAVPSKKRRKTCMSKQTQSTPSASAPPYPAPAQPAPADTVEIVSSCDSITRNTPSCSSPPRALSIPATFIRAPPKRRTPRIPRVPQSLNHSPKPIKPSKSRVNVHKQAEDGTFKKLFKRTILDRSWMLTRDVLHHVKSLADEMEKEGHIWCKVGLVRNDAIVAGSTKNTEQYKQPLYPVVSVPRGFGAKGRRSSWTFTCTLGGRCLHSPCHSDIPSVEDAPDPAPQPEIRWFQITQPDPGPTPTSAPAPAPPPAPDPAVPSGKIRKTRRSKPTQSTPSAPTPAPPSPSHAPAPAPAHAPAPASVPSPAPVDLAVNTTQQRQTKKCMYIQTQSAPAVPLAVTSRYAKYRRNILSDNYETPVQRCSSDSAPSKSQPTSISDSVLKKPCQPKETSPISQIDILTTSPKQEVCMDADSVQNESSMDYCATYPRNAILDYCSQPASDFSSDSESYISADESSESECGEPSIEPQQSDVTRIISFEEFMKNKGHLCKTIVSFSHAFSLDRKSLHGEALKLPTFSFSSGDIIAPPLQLPSQETVTVQPTKKKAREDTKKIVSPKMVLSLQWFL